MVAHKVVIIGSGPAGYTAAIYAGRANLSPVLLAGLQPGGQLTLTSEVENSPPFPEGLLGPELMERFRAHAARFSQEILDAEATRLDLSRWPFEVVEVLGDVTTGVTAVRLRDVVDGRPRALPVQALFVAIGHVPNTALVRGQLALDANGYVVTQPRSTHTSVPGVFACGDVQDPVYRQAVTAAGTGCMAAMDAERWLEARELDNATH